MKTNYIEDYTQENKAGEEKQNNLLKRIYSELFESEDIINYLTQNDLSIFDILSIIGGAPVTLRRKKELIEFLIKERKFNGTFEYIKDIDELECNNILCNQKDYSKDYIENALLSFYLNEVDLAINELDKSESEVFLFSGYVVNNKHEDNFTGKIPVLDFDDALTRMMEELAYDLTYKSDHTTKNEKKVIKNFVKSYWFEIEKWKCENYNEYTSSLCYKHHYTYTILPDKGWEVCYFEKMRTDDKEIPFSRFENIFAKNPDLNIMLPFKAGDICVTNCYPFINEKIFVLEQNGNKTDCCSPQGIYVDRNIIQSGAVKHNHAWSLNSVNAYSCLYKLKKYKKGLSGRAKILKSISDYINHNEDRGKEIYDFIGLKERKKEDMKNFLESKM